MIMIITHCGQQSEKSSFHAKINYADFVQFFCNSAHELVVVKNQSCTDRTIFESQNNEI